MRFIVISAKKRATMFSLEALAVRDQDKPFSKPADPPPASPPEKSIEAIAEFHLRKYMR